MMGLQPHDHVVFYGDSITEQRLYTTYVEDYVVTRHPTWTVDFVNAGWASDTVAGGFGGEIDLRLRRDVLAHHPTVATVMLGMNDGHRLAWNAPMATAFETGYRHLLDVLAPAARLTLLQPSPYDDVTRPPDYAGGYNGVLLKFAAFVGEEARKRHLGLADLNGPVTRMLAAANAKNPELARKLLPDRIHPGAAAHWVMAGAVLEAWQAEPWVSRVALAREGSRWQVKEAFNATIQDAGNGLGWTATEAALPLPIDRGDEAVRLVLASSDVEARLNREPLTVTGLAPGRYKLTIDEQAVGAFDAAVLAGGIDLAGLDTPMTRQAAAVHALTVAHQQVRFNRWRGVQVATADWPSPARDRAAAALADLDADLIRRQHAAARPHPHRFTLIRQ